MNHALVVRFLGVGLATSIGLSACASSAPPPAPTPVPASAAAQPRVYRWSIKTRENVDLWLHGYAMLQSDSNPPLVPLFLRGYRDDLTVLKNKANILTQFDVNVDRLRAGMASDPMLFNAQFVGQYFATVDEMRTTIEHFVAAEGNPRAASSSNEAYAFAMLSSYFSTPAERGWLALFSSGLWDEDTKFYHSYWMQQERSRENVIDSVQGLWQNNLRPRIQGFLNNTQQANGEIILSLPLDGEGRTLGAGGNKQTSTVITFPSRPSDALNAIYALAHELANPITNPAINDNITPAQSRSGYGQQLASAASVQGGLLLLEKFAPDFADGYARYYIQQTGKPLSANPRAQIATLFPLPAVIHDAIARQFDMVQGGI